MVERAYEEYLIHECRSQQRYKRDLEKTAWRLTGDARERQLEKATEYEMDRCIELGDLFPSNGQYGYRPR